MYEFVTHTWNAIKGQCYHDCSYCYMKRWGNLKAVRLDEKELQTDLGKDNFIFVGSSCDMFANDIPNEWIRKVLVHMDKFENKYLLQTKNPDRILDFIDASVISDKSVICTTIESNRDYKEIMNRSPRIDSRVIAMTELSSVVDTYVTIEPILDFDLLNMIDAIRLCYPTQVNIGADSGGHNLPEPSKEKIGQLILKISEFATVNLKPNLKRLYP